MMEETCETLIIGDKNMSITITKQTTFNRYCIENFTHDFLKEMENQVVTHFPEKSSKDAVGILWTELMKILPHRMLEDGWIPENLQNWFDANMQIAIVELGIEDDVEYAV